CSHSELVPRVRMVPLMVGAPAVPGRDLGHGGGDVSAANLAMDPRSACARLAQQDRTQRRSSRRASILSEHIEVTWASPQLAALGQSSLNSTLRALPCRFFVVGSDATAPVCPGRRA